MERTPGQVHYRPETKFVALVLLGILVAASPYPVRPAHHFRNLCIIAPSTSEAEEDVGNPGDRRTSKKAVKKLKTENARLSKELKKLKSEVDQLKSWPDYGESILTDDDS